MSLSVVIARHNENLDWLTCLENTDARIYVYNKADNMFGESPVPVSIKNRVIEEVLPNIGRESHTYLHHISQHYHQLTDTVIFLQGDPHFHCIEIENSLRNWQSYAGKDYHCLSSGYHSINRNTDTYNWDENTKSTEPIWEMTDFFPKSLLKRAIFPVRPGKTYEEMYGFSGPYRFLINYLHLPPVKRYLCIGLAACFSTTKQAIQRIKRVKYQKLRALACAPSILEWDVSIPRVGGPQGEPSDSPGFVLEHLWGYMFRRQSYDTITELVHNRVLIPHRQPVVVMSISTRECSLCTSIDEEYVVDVDKLTVFWKKQGNKRLLTNVLHVVPKNTIPHKTATFTSDAEGQALVKKLMVSGNF